MKKIFNTISVLLLLQSAAYAQQPAHRTTATKVADVLAQQPAEEINKFLDVMKQLEGFSEADVVGLLSGLKPQGQDNAGLEYASNSYAFYVMQPGKEQQRLTYVNGLLQALDKLTDPNNKGYVLELLKFCAKDEAIDKVATYLKDEYLAEKAARVLSGIHTPKAGEALHQALKSASSEKITTAILGAIAEVKVTQAEEDVLVALNKYNSENFQRVALTALSEIGTAKSFDVFNDRAKAANYKFDKANTLGLALDYGNTLLRNNDHKTALRLATNIFNGANGEEAIGAKVGALELLTKINPKKQRKQLRKLATHENAVLRNVALDLLKDHATASDVKKLASSLRKLDPAVQESVLLFLASRNATETIPAIERSFPTITDSDAKIAALTTLSLLSNGQNTDFLLKNLVGANAEEQQAIKTLLLTSKGNDVVPKVNTALATADASAQLVLLEVLAARSNAESSKVVFDILANSNDAKLKAAAYKALPHAVTPADFDKTIDALGKAEENQIADAQAAAISALLSSPDKSAKVDRLAANISRSNAPSAARYFPIFAGEGGATALKTVTNYIGNDNPLKVDAVRALASWSNASSLEALTQLLRSDQQEKHFNTVFNGFVRQVSASDHTAAQKTLFLREAFDIANNAAQKRTALSAMKATGTYQALALAAKYLDDADLKGAATDVVITIATDSYAYTGPEVRQWLEKAMSNISGSESAYLREAIIRHLAEMPAGEPSFVSIFNGQDLTGWKGLVENPIKRAKMSAKELAQKQAVADKEMRESWSAVNGELVFSGRGNNIATVKQYGDFEMLVDWRLDKNGKEPDAGVYLRGTPQVQIWDISRTDVGAQVGSGGLYNNNKHESKPSKVADNPLGDWNTFKIRMIGDKVSVWLNGEQVVDQVVMENFWDRSQPIFPIEQIELQAHGSQVWYRDIFIKELPRKEVFTLSEEEKKEGFEMLFDGTNLDKWTSTPAYEINAEGHLRANPDAKFGKNIYTKDQFADFVYRFEFKLTPGANNGVGIRAPLEGDAAYLGYEIQVLDDDAEVYKNLAPYQYHGSVYGIIPAKRGALKPVGEWNEQEIRIQGSKIKVTLNGKVILDGDIAEASKNGTLDKKDHPGLNKASGHIGFLGHGSEVFYRNIRIKKL